MKYKDVKRSLNFGVFMIKSGSLELSLPECLRRHRADPAEFCRQ